MFYNLTEVADTWECIHTCNHMFQFFLHKYLGIELLGYMVGMYLTAKLFSKVIVPYYIHITNMLGFPVTPNPCLHSGFSVFFVVAIKGSIFSFFLAFFLLKSY